MYEDVPELERRTNLSAEEFYESYLLPRRPVVLVGLKEFDSVLAEWTLPYFKEHFGDQEVALHASRVGFSSWLTTKSRLGDYIDGIVESRWPELDADGYPPPYLALWNAFDPLWSEKALPMPSQYSLPRHFHNYCDFFPRLLKGGIVTQVFIGPSGTRTWLHQDGLATHFWNLLVAGKKRWLLYPPEQAPLLYGAYGRSPVDPEQPDLDRFPRFENARPAYQINQQPGETVFAPSWWWHHVVGSSPTISLSANFIDRTTMGIYLWAMATPLARRLRVILPGI